MKTSLNKIALMFSGLFVYTQTAQAVPTANGDLLIGFYQVIGGAVQSNTYIFNLGPASLYRENTQSNVPVSAINPAIVSSNIGVDLGNAFGDDWQESGTVYWSIFGGTDANTSGVLSGDVLRTPYISLPKTSFVVGSSTTAPTVNSNSRSSVSTQILPIRTGANGTGTNTGNANGAKISASGPLDTTVDSFFPPSSQNNTYLSLGTDLRGLFDAGTIAGSAEQEGALDVYRYTNSITTSGVDLTSGFGNGNAALGVGQYIGTFTIDTSGEVRVFGAAPSTPGYYSFATANAPNLAGGPSADADNDGINNLTEYALNTNLTGPDGSVGTLSGGVLSFTKRAAAVTNGDLTYEIQISTDLGISNPWSPLAGTNTTTTISGSLPAGLPKQFARLKILSSAVAP